MCHGMGLTASAVGERITLVWSLTEPQCGLDLTSLSRLFGATAAPAAEAKARARAREGKAAAAALDTRSHEYPAPLPTDAPPFPLEGAANVSYSEQRRAWNQMAHAKEWNANRPSDVLKLTFNSAAGAGVEQEPEPAP